MPEPKLIKRTTTTTTEEFADDLDNGSDDLEGLNDDSECEPDRKAPDRDDEQKARRRK